MTLAILLRSNLFILEYFDLPIPLNDLCEVINEKSPGLLFSIWCYENIDAFTVELDFSVFFNLAFYIYSSYSALLRDSHLS